MSRPTTLSRPTTRRGFLRSSAGLAAVAAGARLGLGDESTGHGVPKMPTIRLGNLEVSRLILGSNPFFGFAHGNPQASGKEMRAWFTPERIMALLDEAAEHGINAVWTPCYDPWVKLWNDYQERGGKLTIWIGQPDRLPMEKDIQIAVKNGARAIAVQGCRIDAEVQRGKWDVVRAWIELIKSHGLPAGMATHRADTHLAAEEKDLPTDFYHQTLYRPDNYVREGLEQSLATIDKLAKPVVGYKALGAGRILPQDAFPYLFKRLKPKDGLCVGMFPKEDPDQVAENVTLTSKLSVA